ncbi:MAG: glycoside hydrolase family 2 TIM barrel-domain containing protein, partial [Muribaculaceae bacterium]
MKMRLTAFFVTAMMTSTVALGARQESLLKDSWQFCRGEVSSASQWESVTIPHDWAIYGPFDRNNDLQKVAVEQNGEKVATWKTGRTGGLPFIGKGSYKTTFEVADTADRALTLLFDGAMSNAHVMVNGKEVGYWPYGYNSFYVDLKGAVKPGTNNLEVNLENFEQASRWYPGAGLYRNVHLINTHRVHIPVWGTQVTTPEVAPHFATVKLSIEIAGARQKAEWPMGEKVMVKTVILDPNGCEVTSRENEYIARGQKLTQNFVVNHPKLWSPETPALYVARTTLSLDGKVVDSYDTRFGIRSINYIPEKGFFLNGKVTKFKGVCNHHDLGPLGAAVNRAALRHQVELLKEMGANAIRTSHNMPAPELVELCDELGMMLMVEPFDDWSFRPKSPNGYGRFFNEWAERDMENMVKH